MSNQLLEANVPTIDLRAIYATSPVLNAEDTPESDSSTETERARTPDDTSGTTNELKQLLMSKGVDEETARRIILFGEPFKKAVRVLGTKTEPSKGSNPLLAFVIQDYVKNKLINTGLLNINTFKVLYNAVAAKLVADSEFFEHTPQNDYNIIYCADFYRKPVKEMLDYLKLQSNILDVNASVYSAETQIKNKKAFIFIKGVYKAGTTEEESDPIKRANLIKKIDSAKAKAVTAGDAVLNKLDIVKILCNIKQAEQTELTTDNQNDIVKKLAGLGVEQKSAAFATLLALSMNTDSPVAKKALKHEVFADINAQDTLNALHKFAGTSILPRGQIKPADADSLAHKLLATVVQK
jgi:hypothetical protein